MNLDVDCGTQRLIYWIDNLRSVAIDLCAGNPIGGATGSRSTNDFVRCTDDGVLACTPTQHCESANGSRFAV